MWKRELLKNKLYALLLVGLSLPVMFLDGDATVTVLMLFFAVPDWFVSKLQEKYGISDMHAQSLIKFMKERGDDDCPGTIEKMQRATQTLRPTKP